MCELFQILITSAVIEEKLRVYLDRLSSTIILMVDGVEQLPTNTTLVMLVKSVNQENDRRAREPFYRRTGCRLSDASPSRRPAEGGLPR